LWPHIKLSVAHSKGNINCNSGLKCHNSKCTGTKHDAEIADGKSASELTPADSDVGEERLKTVESLSQDVQSKLEVILPTVECGGVVGGEHLRIALRGIKH